MPLPLSGEDSGEGSGGDAVSGAGIESGIIGEGLDGWLSPDIGESKCSNGDGIDDPDAPGIDGPGVDLPVAVNSDNIFSLRVVLSSV